MLSKISFLGLRKLISQLFRDANTNNSIDLRQNMHYLAEVIKVSKLKKNNVTLANKLFSVCPNSEMLVFKAIAI